MYVGRNNFHNIVYISAKCSIKLADCSIRVPRSRTPLMLTQILGATSSDNEVDLGMLRPKSAYSAY